MRLAGLAVTIGLFSRQRHFFMTPTAGTQPPTGINTWPTWVGLGLVRIIGSLPNQWLNALCRGVARLSLRHNSRQARAIGINLAACFPDLTSVQRTALHHQYLAAFYRVILLSPRVWWGSEEVVKRMTRYCGREHLDQAIDTGRPVILLVSHTVALDAGLICMTRDYPLQGLYKSFKNPVLDAVVYRARTRFGGQLTHRQAGLRPAVKALKRGRILSYFGDEDLGKTDAVFAPFFAHQKATLTVLPRLATNSDALVVPMASYYNASDNTIEINLLPALPAFADPGCQNADREDLDRKNRSRKDLDSNDGYRNDVSPQSSDHKASGYKTSGHKTSGRVLTRQAAMINRAIEDTIALCPEQYLWKLRLFKTCPTGQALSRYLQIERGQLKVEEL